jgi:hypothetical protein
MADLLAHWTIPYRRLTIQGSAPRLHPGTLTSSTERVQDVVARRIMKQLPGRGSPDTAVPHPSSPLHVEEAAMMEVR